MNRRKAIIRISLTGAGLATLGAGYKWFKMTKSPDLTYLDSSRALLNALAETIIPATDAPGAKEAGVTDFIIIMVKDCTDRKNQNTFIDGLKDVQDYSHSAFGAPFERCSIIQQEAILTHFEKRDHGPGGLLEKAQNRYLGKSFFAILKEYTVEGYCTSEPGATRGLILIAVPGSFHGCMPMTPGQRAWAIN